jgi:hypothetical protein
MRSQGAGVDSELLPWLVTGLVLVAAGALAYGMARRAQAASADR